MFPFTKAARAPSLSETASLRRGRRPPHAGKHSLEQRGPPGPPDWSPAGEDGKALPESPSELRSGVGLAHSTDDAAEGNEVRRGKGPAREDPSRGGGGPDAEPGRLATQSRASERGGPQGRPDPVHRPAASRRHRGARTSVSAAEAAGKRGGRWDHGGDYEQNLEANLQDLCRASTPGATDRSRFGASTSRKPMAVSDRSVCRPWRTRSSRARSPRC